MYVVFIEVSLLLPGYTLVRYCKILEKSPGLQLCLGYAASLVLFALLATANYGLHVPYTLTRLFCWLALLVAAGIFIKQRYDRRLLKQRFPLLCLLAMNCLSLLFISLHFGQPYKIIPDPTPQPGAHYSVLDVKILNLAQTPANDNSIPYRQAQFFMNRSDPAKDSFISEWGVTFFERTPLMGAVVANYFNLLHDKPPIGYIWNADAQDPDHTFIKFQIIAHILNGLLVIPAFYLLSALLSRRTALVSCLFLVTNQYFIYNSFFSWPKSLVAFFILTSWLLLLQKGRLATLLAGVVSGAAYLTHDLAVLYVGASVVYLLWQKRWRDILYLLIPTGLCMAPWMLLARHKYNQPSTFIYYPFSLKDIPSVQDEPKLIPQFFHTSPFKIIGIKLHSLYYLLAPYQLLTSEGHQAIDRRLWALGLYTVPGAVGFGLLVPAYVGIIKLFRKVWPFIFILLPVIFCTLLIGWRDGLGALHFAEAAVVLATGLAIHWLLELRRKLWLLLAFGVNCAQLAFLTLYSYAYNVAAWLHNARSMLAVILMLGIMVGSGYLIRNSLVKKPKQWLLVE